MVKQTMGLSQEEYNKQASAHSKANIILWLISGVIYNIYSDNLMSLSTLLLVIPGIFVASFASMPTFLVNIKKHQILKDQIVTNTKNVLILSLFTIWYVIDLVFPIVLAILYISLVKYLVALF